MKIPFIVRNNNTIKIVVQSCYVRVSIPLNSPKLDQKATMQSLLQIFIFCILNVFDIKKETNNYSLVSARAKIDM